MNRTNFLIVSAAATLLTALAGCQKQPQMSMEEMMKPQPRPAELDQLETYVGTWEMSGKMKIHGVDKIIECTGTTTAAWENNRMLLVERSEYVMDGKPENKMAGFAVWNWNAAKKKFEIAWWEMGCNAGEGYAWYDAKAGIWHMRSENVNPMTGEENVGEGTYKIIDKNTIEWSYCQWNSWKTQKVCEMTGTSRRK